jgi:hypothetical protein
MGDSLTTGASNTFVGEAAGKSTTEGNENSFFGVSAGLNNSTGSSNSFFGRDAGRNNSIGTYNSFFGRKAGRNNLTGHRNVSIGFESGPTSENDSSSYRLYMDVETSDDPLIYGEFDNDFVRINGTFEVTAGLSNPSSETIKDHFKNVDVLEILEKIQTLSIQEWSYKHLPDVRHMGPTSESFYETFGLGDGNTTICTIDADGIALIAIQALHEKVRALELKNDELVEVSEEQRKRVRELREKNEQLQATLISLVERVENLENSLDKSGMQ